MKPKIHPIETEVLTTINEKYLPTSRLACAIKLKPWMNGMVVRVMDSPNEYGIPKDAGVFTGTGGNFIN
jgi:hypothetical protein